MKFLAKLKHNLSIGFFTKMSRFAICGRKTVDATNKNILDVVFELLKETELTCKLVERNIIIFPKSENPHGQPYSAAKIHIRKGY